MFLEFKGNAGKLYHDLVNTLKKKCRLNSRVRHILSSFSFVSRLNACFRLTNTNLYELQTTPRTFGKNIVQALRPQEYDPQGENYVKFSEFIQYFSSNISRNQHWRQYEKICHPCAINYDFIGHFETMGADGPMVLKMAGIDDRATFPSIYESTGSDEVLEYYSQAPPRYIRKLGEQYRSDFEMFGYEYLGSVKKLLNKSISDD